MATSSCACTAFLCGGNHTLFRVQRRSSLRAHSLRTGRVLEIHRQERVMLENTWAMVTDRHKLGDMVLLQVFETKPLLRHLFKFGHLRKEEELVKHPLFKKHSGSFSMFLHVTLSRLLAGEVEELLDITHHVGIAHATFRAVSFDAEYWLMFKNAVIDQLEPYFIKAKLPVPDARHVWQRFLMFVIMEMKTAFNQHKIKRLSCPDLRNTVYETLVDDYENLDAHSGDYQPSLVSKLESLQGSMTTLPGRRAMSVGDKLVSARTMSSNSLTPGDQPLRQRLRRKFGIQPTFISRSPSPNNRSPTESLQQINDAANNNNNNNNLTVGFEMRSFYCGGSHEVVAEETESDYSNRGSRSSTSERGAVGVGHLLPTTQSHPSIPQMAASMAADGRQTLSGGATPTTTTTNHQLPRTLARTRQCLRQIVNNLRGRKRSVSYNNGVHVHR